MSKKCFSPEDVARLKQFIEDGCRLLQEVDDLKLGLKETVNAISDEMDIKPAILNKVLRVAFKQSINDERSKIDEIEELLEAAGRLP